MKVLACCFPRIAYGTVVGSHKVDGTWRWKVLDCESGEILTGFHEHDLTPIPAQLESVVEQYAREFKLLMKLNAPLDEQARFVEWVGKLNQIQTALVLADHFAGPYFAQN